MAKQRQVEKVESVENEKVRVSFIPRYCKGCEICVKLCPTQVLGMEMFKARVVDIDRCIICLQCEQRCPDFAVFVEKKEPPK